MEKARDYYEEKRDGYHGLTDIQIERLKRKQRSKEAKARTLIQRNKNIAARNKKEKQECQSRIQYHSQQIIKNGKSIPERIYNWFDKFITSDKQPNDFERQLAEQRRENAILRNINAELHQHNPQPVFAECVAVAIPQTQIAQCAKISNSTEYFQDDFPLASAPPDPNGKL